MFRVCAKTGEALLPALRGPSSLTLPMPSPTTTVALPTMLSITHKRQKQTLIVRSLSVIVLHKRGTQLIGGGFLPAQKPSQRLQGLARNGLLLQLFGYTKKP